jgi:fermentation-respiration switch protein FrsA (DUF1100 family)
LNQWSLDRTFGDSLRPEIDVPILIELGTGDTSVLPAMGQGMYDAATKAPVRDLNFVTGAGHYFENQPDLLAECLDHMTAWITKHVGAP